jgi:hypothetical protein
MGGERRVFQGHEVGVVIKMELKAPLLTPASHQKEVL